MMEDLINWVGMNKHLFTQDRQIRTVQNIITAKSNLLNQCIYWAGLQSTERSGAEVAHAFNPNTQEAEAHGLLSLKPSWSTE